MYADEGYLDRLRATLHAYLLLSQTPHGILTPPHEATVSKRGE
jgi:hypothetical protein